MNKILSSSIATRTRGAEQAYVTDATNLTCHFCHCLAGNLTELKAHVLKHMKSGKRSKAIQAIDSMLRAANTPISHRVPAGTALEEKFRDFFPEEFRDSSPEGNRNTPEKRQEEGRKVSTSTPTVPVDKTPSPSPPKFAPAKHWVVEFSPMRANATDKQSMPIATECEKSIPNPNELDVLQQILGSQEETLLDSDQQTPHITQENNSTAETSEVASPPESKVIEAADPPPKRKKARRHGKRSSLQKCPHCNLAFYTKASLEHKRGGSVTQGARGYPPSE
ncbi:hypothetical protein TNCV_3305281 [Trichonephila clavipes]|nr:hypothetical protein TNCV_3305281 [Trichonephila clavipes]